MRVEINTIDKFIIRDQSGKIVDEFEIIHHGFEKFNDGRKELTLTKKAKPLASLDIKG